MTYVPNMIHICPNNLSERESIQARKVIGVVPTTEPPMTKSDD